MRSFGSALVLLAVVTLGCDLGGDHTIKHKDKQRRNYTRGLPLRIETTNGAVKVHGLQNSQAITILHEKDVTAPKFTAAESLRDRSKLEYRPQKHVVLLRVVDPSLGPGESIEHHIDVTVPENVPLTITQANGPLAADRLAAGMDLSTTNGAITVDEVKGAVRARVSNGRVEVTGLDGSVDIEVGNGKISVDARVLRCPASGCHARTTNGAIRFALPETSRVALSAQTTNGTVHSELPLQGGQAGPTSLTGMLGGGGPDLTLNATNGTIQVLKRYIK